MKQTDRNRIFLTIFLTMIGLSFCLWSLIDYYRLGYESEAKYEALADLCKPLPTQAAAQDFAEAPIPFREILPEYQVLVDWNPDFVGWLEIENTAINYPVVQTAEDPEYYLYRHFDGDKNSRGCLFAEATCDVALSDNVTVYGHNMTDGTMFADLLRYADPAFLDSHPLIRFDSRREHRSYRIFAVFRTTAIAGEGFEYHKFTDARNEADFNAFIDHILAISLYPTDITPQYGDQVLCLSTCESYEDHERFVVAAVLYYE